MLSQVALYGTTTLITTFVAAYGTNGVSVQVARNQAVSATIVFVGPFSETKPVTVYTVDGFLKENEANAEVPKTATIGQAPTNLAAKRLK